MNDCDGNRAGNVIVSQMLRLAIPIATFLGLAAISSTASASKCISDAELEAVVGAQIRSGAFAINTAALGDRPTCAGLTIAQAIQRLSQKLAPASPKPDAGPARSGPRSTSRPTSPPSNQKRIPAAFLGEWVTDLRHCGQKDNEDVLIIEPDGIQYYEHREDVTGLVFHSPREITVTVHGVYGDEEWSETHQIKVSEDGRQIRFAAASRPSYRCP